ncbi:MAG: AraC family transcriptional regulator [Spirochaetes bacterium]|nr:AraC family transcriptional regulator [Spirochaetota bacterium]
MSRHAETGMINLALTSINLIIGVAVAIWAALQLVQKKKSSMQRTIALLYFLMAYVLFYYWSFRSGVIYLAPRLIYSDLPVAFAIGPSAYLYVARLLGIHERFTKSMFLHFIPALLAVCALAAYHLFSGGSMAFFLAHRPAYPVYNDPFILAFDILSDLWVVLYLLAAAIRVFVFGRSTMPAQNNKLVLISVLLLAVSLSYLGVLYAHIVDDKGLLIVSSVVNGALIVSCFLFSHRNPEVTQSVIRDGRKAGSLPANVDVAGVIGRMMEMIENEKVYRDPEITIQSLSNSLEISAYHLSLILNEKMRMNFRSFINRYRLEEAKRLLTHEPEKSIIEVAFAVGFNSKTAFNTLFSREAGVTPREYRKTFLKK